VTLDGVTHVVFDVDGTLLDSRPAIVAAYRHAFGTVLGIEFPRDDEVRALLAPRLREVCETHAGDRAAEVEAAYRSFYLERGDALVRAMPGAVELLEGLEKRGLAVALVTNKGRERLGPDLRRGGLDGFELAATVCSEDAVERKPHPEPFEVALRRCGVEAAAALYVGDGPQDVQAAKAAGSRVVGAAYGYYGAEALAPFEPTATIARADDLLELLPA
jgi:HAD superfamily hydrolase (TIGR01509 family)